MAELTWQGSPSNPASWVTGKEWMEARPARDPIRPGHRVRMKDSDLWWMVETEADADGNVGVVRTVRRVTYVGPCNREEYDHYIRERLPLCCLEAEAPQAVQVMSPRWSFFWPAYLAVGLGAFCWMVGWGIAQLINWASRCPGQSW